MNAGILVVAVLALVLSACAQCPVETVIVSGHVNNAAPHSKVRVQLLYPKGKAGEAGEVSIDDGSFRIPLEFVTAQNSILTNLPKRCGRKPQSVEITLMENDKEADRVTLDFAKDFKMADFSAYTPRSDLVLNASR